MPSKIFLYLAIAGVIVCYLLGMIAGVFVGQLYCK